MNCWHCDRPSHGSCFFCGRGVCKEHARTMPGLLTLFRDRGETLRGMVVDTVLWCGVCNPKRYPVNLDVIDPGPAERLALDEAAAAAADDGSGAGSESADHLGDAQRRVESTDAPGDRLAD